MKKGKQPHPLQKPVHPHYAKAVLIGGAILAVLAIIAVIWFNASPSAPKSTPKVATIPTSSSAPTATPTTVDTSNWKTYTDWKYGYSVKLPPEFASYIPGKGYTGNTIDPQGNGFVQFEDTTLSGDYPNRTAKYGFYVRLEKNTEQGDFNCTTDQECSNLVERNFNIDRANGDGTNVMLIHTQILNKDIKGLATITPTGTGVNGKDISLEYFYPFIANGQLFSAEISFYYPKGFQQAQTKDPVINAILSTISFNQ